MFKRHPMATLGIAVTVLFLLLGHYRVNFLDTLDLKLYDVQMGLRGVPEATSNILMVDIDDDTIEQLGRWPWPRHLIAKGIDKIAAGEPRVIGVNFILSEPERTPGLGTLRALEDQFISDIHGQIGRRGDGFLEALRSAQRRIDYDTTLADSLRASGNVILPVFFKSTRTTADSQQPLPSPLDPLLIHRVTNPQSLGVASGTELVLPIDPFLIEAQGIGHINLAFDVDGTARRERLIYGYRDAYVPSYALRLAAAFNNIPITDIQVTLGSHLTMGQTSIPLTLQSDMLIAFKGPRDSFKRYSYVDIINDKVPPRIFKDRMVLVGASAAGITNPLSSPTDATMPLSEFSAHTIWSMLNRQQIAQPVWGPAAELLTLLVIGLLIILFFPRMGAIMNALAFWLLVGGLLGGSTWALVSEGLWVRCMYPLLMLICGYIGVITIKYFVSETGKIKVEGESAETNRMLGLSFQNQGMLDMAFDKLRRVPVDNQMKDILYNLALDYERKRQFSKAAAVLAYVEEHDAKFKDVKKRKKKLAAASENLVYGDNALGGAKSDDLTLTATGTRPTLGRYEVMKQLGKGAMGVVYLGMDPRINRTTAIKTFRFADDLTPSEADAMKQKFFREAESAGTLSHPNIVTIYDAGDEQDLAYIAMEYLEGKTLEAYTKKSQLLPIRKVMEYMADIADALDYAHRMGIVHRDVKPANIMILKSGVIKITDFGIARITATSKTQTGVVKGTPYYMSPEQFSGEKVDGRSDIFSLGTMTYQLLTGRLPFRGDSPPALMNQIMNVRHPDPRKFNGRIPKPLVSIIDKTMAKKRDERYQKAGGMAGHLRQLIKMVDTVAARRQASG